MPPRLQRSAALRSAATNEALAPACEEDVLELLVAADESERLLESVLPAIGKLAADVVPGITVLHVVHGAAEAWSDDELRLVLAERRDQLEQLLVDSDFPTELLVETLPYGDEIPSYLAGRARDLDVDAIVVCSKRATGVFAGILGSVAQGLLRESNVPVLVVRPDREAGEPAEMQVEG
jgi:nucleotide-binding universal stress UspA family protein